MCVLAAGAWGCAGARTSLASRSLHLPLTRKAHHEEPLVLRAPLRHRARGEALRDGQEESRTQQTHSRARVPPPYYNRRPTRASPKPATTSGAPARRGSRRSRRARSLARRGGRRRRGAIARRPAAAAAWRGAAAVCACVSSERLGFRVRVRVRVRARARARARLRVWLRGGTCPAPCGRAARRPMRR